MRIDDYFAQLEQMIARCPLVTSKTVMLDARTDYRGIIRGTLYFFNQTVLYFTEVVDTKVRIDKLKYRYQYQYLSSNERIFRYDNAKHFPKLPTYPHHKHIGPETINEQGVEAPEMSLEDVIHEIERVVIITTEK